MMDIFKQLRTPDKQVENTNQVVHDFERRIPYWSYRPINYKLYKPFLEYKNQIDEYLKMLFSGEIDEGNGDVLDTMIMDMARQAEKDLEHQRTEHRDTIKSFDIRAKSDQKAFEDQLNLLKEMLEQNLAKQAQYANLVADDEILRGRA